MSIASRIVLIAALASAGACGKNDAPPEVAAGTNALVIPVDGMACGRCASRVQRTLSAIDGVADAEVSLDQKRVVVHYDARKLSPDRLVSAIDGAGFHAGAPEAIR